MFKINKGAWPSISVLLGAVLFCYWLGGCISLLVTCLIYNKGFFEIQQLIKMPDQTGNGVQVLMTYLILNSLFSFLFIPLMYLRATKANISNYKHGEISLWLLVLSVAIIFAIIPLNSFIVSFNQSIRFPSFLSGMEDKLVEYENFSKNIITVLLSSKYPGMYFKLALTLAIIPGIVEEFFFRKLLQPKLIEITGNAHCGIIFCSLTFSIMHFQFYGILPRLLFGIVFGYLYLWSRDLIYPIIAHIINNLMVVTLGFYFSSRDLGIQREIDKPIVIVGSLVMTTIILLLIRRKQRKSYKLVR